MQSAALPFDARAEGKGSMRLGIAGIAGGGWRGRAGPFGLAALALSAISAAAGAPASPPSDAVFRSLALQWFERMHAGTIDRTQLSAAYSAQLTDEAVRMMARRMQSSDYGAAPLQAEIVSTGRCAVETFAIVKLIFPRGDFASLLIGLDPDGKIAGLGLMSMAGD
jgi:hypothetical protein